MGSQQGNALLNLLSRQQEGWVTAKGHPSPASGLGKGSLGLEWKLSILISTPCSKGMNLPPHSSNKTFYSTLASLKGHHPAQRKGCKPSELSWHTNVGPLSANCNTPWGVFPQGKLECTRIGLPQHS